MIRKLVYVLIALCISFFAMHDAKGHAAADAVDFAAQQEQVLVASLTDFYISEVSHEQTPARPSNISVPVPARTIQANRTSNTSRINSLCGKSDVSQKRLYSYVYNNEAFLLPFGFTDLSDHFHSLRKLII